MTSNDLRRLPKVVLHDHLDGGLRPQTVLDLAASGGYGNLPSHDVDELTEWFFQGVTSSLEQYLQAFVHTVGVMQTAEALERVAYEAAEDLADDGVVYAEIRMAPSLCLGRGLNRAEVIGAILKGFRKAESDFGVPVRLIVDAMRQQPDSVDVAKAALDFVGDGVVGFDLAGPEAGYPAASHREACEVALGGGLGLTLHAGEGDGVPSIAGALEVGAERLGHGVRIVEDVRAEDGEVVSLGPIASQIRDGRVPLEICPTSNLQTGMYVNAAEHPIGMLHRAGFAVTLNTDNRLMSQIGPTDEFELVTAHHGFGTGDLESVTLQAIDAAFCDETTRAAVRRRVIGGYESALAG